jgi:uncharacterized protein GlcG (DUF336 family)
MNTFSKASISLEAARVVMEAAQVQAIQEGLAIAITIVDESGVMKSFVRMNGAPLVAVEVSRRKALTAVGFGMSTGKDWYDFIKDDPILSNGADSIPDFTLLGGGLPIWLDEQLVGAIGVSGGHYSVDERCAQAGLAALS